MFMLKRSTFHRYNLCLSSSMPSNCCSSSVTIPEPSYGGLECTPFSSTTYSLISTNRLILRNPRYVYCEWRNRKYFLYLYKTLFFSYSFEIKFNFINNNCYVLVTEGEKRRKISSRCQIGLKGQSIATSQRFQ